MEMVPVIFDFHRYNKIGLLGSLEQTYLSKQEIIARINEHYFFERAVYQSFVKIKYKAFTTDMLRRYGREQGFWSTVL